MLEHIAKAATQGYLISWLQYTIAFSPYHRNLTEALKRFLKWNLEIVADSKDYGDLDANIMILLLQQHDIVVKSEYELFWWVAGLLRPCFIGSFCTIYVILYLRLLEKWLMCKKEQLDNDNSMSDIEKESIFRNLIESTIVHIRFSMMSPKELAHLLLNQVVSYHKEFLVQRMAIGMSYHSGTV